MWVHMAIQRPHPTNAEHIVDVNDLFFSTTDARGIIRAGNSVFVDISRYSLDELIGKPHNIIRHPSMPAGAFHLMWERLNAGLPMAAYVQNMAADGATYWVFATVTPHRDGFLSVRAAPCSSLFSVVRKVYEDTREQEQERFIAGANRAEVARFGATVIQDHVQRLGFETYESFMHEALATEVSARLAQVDARSFERPGATGPAADVLHAANELGRQLAALNGRMQEYGDLVSKLSPVSVHLHESANSLVKLSSEAIEASDRTGKQVLSNVSRVMAQPMEEAVDSLAGLSPRVAEVIRTARKERFAIALARLHAEMAVGFAAEAIDGHAPMGSSSEVPELCDALAVDIEAMVVGIDQLGALLKTVSEEIDTAGERYQTFRTFLGEWSRLAIRNIHDISVDELVNLAGASLVDGRKKIEALSAMAAQCRGAGAAFDVTAFSVPIERMRMATGAIQV